MSKCRQVKTSLSISTNELLLMENEDLLALLPKGGGWLVGNGSGYANALHLQKIFTTFFCN